MLNRISISKHPVEFVIQQIHHILPGVEKVYCYYFDERDFNVKLIANLNGSTESLPIKEEQLFLIQKQRGVAQKYEWFKENYELFNLQENQFQITLEDSYKQNLLCLRFENPVDHLHDMILIHLSGKTGIFKLAAEEDTINSDEKSIVERLTYNSLKFVLDNERNNKKLYQNVVNNVESLKKSNNLLKQEVISNEDSYIKSISYFCKTYAYKIAKQENVSLTITQDAINKVISENIPFDKIEPLLRQTIEMCLNRTLDLNDNIVIGEFDLIIPDTNKNQVDKPSEEVVISDRYAKTKEYLDRYEEAAEIIVKKGISLTGKNIGSHCSPSISAAAISDNIKKHRSKIVTLLNRYHEKWPIIRENYRPIIKLTDNRGENPMKQAV